MFYLVIKSIGCDCLDISGDIIYNIKMIKKEKTTKTQPQALMLRIPRTLHADILRAAEAEGVSLNQYCIYILSGAVGKKQ